jgi:hypothetical protein
VHIPIDSHLAPGLESLVPGNVASIEFSGIPASPPLLWAAENT